jgi:hypothetical protein
MPEQISTVALLAGVTAVALGIVSVLLREHWLKTREHDGRLRALEQHGATTQDVDRIHARIDALGDKLDAQHHATMQTLLDMTKRLGP